MAISVDSPAVNLQQPPVDPPLHGPQPAARLGEELPIFCEKCGYSLFGLPVGRCEHCTLLHLRCPECGHSQAVNTLRPAFQRILGRMRAWVIGLTVLIKCNILGWSSFGFFISGHELAFQWNGRSNGYGQYEMRSEEYVILFAFAFVWGVVNRLILLRWRSGVLVGVVLGALLYTAMTLGSLFEYWLSTRYPSMPNQGFRLATIWAGLLAFTGAMVSWPVVVLMVKVFLPEKISRPFLGWLGGTDAQSAEQLDAGHPTHPTHTPRPSHKPIGG